MISQFLDILFILLSVFGYFGGFYDAFELTLPFFMMLLVMLLSLIFYYFWKLDKKIQKITLIVILAVTIISIPIWFNGAKSFIGLIINYYSYRDIHVSIVSWQVNTASTSYFLFLLLINIYVVLIMTHYYQARKHLLLHYLPAILYLFIPVLYQYIPEYYYLTALIGVVLTLYLSRYINQQHDQWIKIISLILIGVVTFALPQIYPTNSYERLFTLDYVKEKINSISNEMVDADEIKPTRVDLSEVSTINPSDAVELYIQTDNSTSFKLKEQDYTTYRSTSWTKTDTTSENRLNQIRLDQLSLLEGTSSALTITNGDGKALNERYTPYYTKTHEDGEFEIMLYTDLSLTSLLELPVNDELIEYEEEMESTYLNYPTYLENLLRGALNTAGVTSSDDVAAIVDKVVTYLDENFTYTYQAAKPEEDQDFVVAFYRSGKGYCIHFATFATLLLRYSGIMARYVEGYQVRSYDETINTFIVT